MVMLSALKNIFEAPGRALDALDAMAVATVNPPRDYVGMCRCGERLSSTLELEQGECCHCATRWA